jgi:hypothetical protein
VRAPFESALDPPRAVPLPVRLRVLFGGMVSQMGWFFLGFGLIFVWVFAVHVDLSGPRRLLTRQVETRGQVTAIEDTNISEGGDDDTPGTPIYRILYRFAGPGGRRLEGASYSVGTDLQPGDLVRVEYAASNPEVSRILGLRQAPLPLAALFVVVFPFIGLVMVVYSLMEGFKGVRLLRQGVLAQANLLSAEPTSMSVNNRPVVRMTFDFTDADGGLHEVSSRTTQPELLQDQQTETVLYDPRRPEDAVMLDALPGSPRLNSDGSLEIEAPQLAYALVIIPALTVIGHGAYLLLRFLGLP